jgi:hypothetical protein
MHGIITEQLGGGVRWHDLKGIGNWNCERGRKTLD